MRKTIVTYFLVFLTSVSFCQKSKIVNAITKTAIRNASKTAIKTEVKKDIIVFFVAKSKNSYKKYLTPDESLKFLERTFSKTKAERIFTKLGNKKINEIYNLIPEKMDSDLRKVFVHDMYSDDIFFKIISEKPNLLNCCYNKLLNTGPYYRRNPQLLMDIFKGKRPLNLNTINSQYANKYLNGVNFRNKKIILESGLEINGVFANFKKFSVFEIGIPNKSILSKDRNQMALAFMKFRENLKINPDLQKKFTKEQLEEIFLRKKILDNSNIPGYTWHHTETKSLQLVEKEIHDLVKHTGGRALHGAGSTLR